MSSEFRGLPDVRSVDFLPRVKETLEMLTTQRRGFGQIPPGIQSGIDGAIMDAREGAREDLGTFIRQITSANDLTFIRFLEGFDPSQFLAYDFHFDGVRPATAAALRLRVSTNGGATFDTTVGSYSWVAEQWNVEAATRTIAASTTTTALHLSANVSVQNTAVSAVSGVCRIYSPADVGNHSSVFSQLMYRNVSGQHVHVVTGGRYDVAARINTVQFDFAAGPLITSGNIIMHGVRKR